MASTNFTGPLGTKLVSELREIAEALEIEVSGKKAELKDAIQTALNEREAELSVQDAFKGLYGKKRGRQSGSDSETPDGIVGELKPAVRAARKSVIKTVDRLKEVVDAANIPLPESPLANKVAAAASNAVETIQSTSTALIPVSTNTRKDVVLYATQGKDYVVRYFNQGQARVDSLFIGPVKEFLATPQHLVMTSLGLEFFHLLVHLSQLYNHTVFFPPISNNTLVSGLFSWAPRVQFTFPVPEWAGWIIGAENRWVGVAWWLIATVLPAAAASSILQFGAVPHKGVTTRHQAAHQPPKFDPLSFALVRFALLIWLLTSAAPPAFVDALELGGNLQGRALFGGVVAGLLLIQRLSPQH